MKKKFEIVYLPVSELKGYENNAKIHTPEQIKQLKASFSEFDFTVPVLVDADYLLISGHGRVEAAIAAGIEEVPAIIRDDLTKEQVRQLRLVENNVTSTKYDNGKLLDEMNAIIGIDIQFADIFKDTGFEKEIEAMIDADDTFGELDESAFDFDMDDAVSGMESEALNAAEEADNKPVPLRTIFGGTHVMKSQVKSIKAFIANAEATTGASGLDALVALGDAILKKE